MYYDTYRGKNRPKGRRRRASSGCLGWILATLFKLIALVLVLALLVAAALYAVPVALMNVEPTGMELSPTDGLSGRRVNILLLGLDALNEGSRRSDAILVASIGYGGLKLTSILRDTLVEIPGHGRRKINSAYAYGGPELVMRTINENFQLNITNYIAVDFSTLVDLVDALGGVDLEVRERELADLNHYAYDTYRSISALYPEKYAHYAVNPQPETRTGTLRLNGLYATSYARIRYCDSDYQRTNRQRAVISAIVRRFRECCWNPLLYKSLLEVLRCGVHTNLTLPELISLGEKVLIAGKIETNRIPYDTCLSDNGSSIEITNAQENVRMLHSYIYGE